MYADQNSAHLDTTLVYARPEEMLVAAERTSQTATRILDAARASLLADGFAALSTRKVAERAGVPLSQIHYHFGSKQALVLALLERENRTLVERQRLMYGAETPLWQRYQQACEFLDDDLASGYVRVLQEMIAAGWSNPIVAAEVLRLLQAWIDLLDQVAREAATRLGSLGPLTPADLANLIALAFLGSESVILLGDPDWERRIRVALRSLGILIKSLEEAAPAD